MNTFHMTVGAPLQGNFEKKKVNLAFVFQVNCPGCFAYGIPIVNELHNRYANSVGFIGISTAFEDFEFNSEINTNKLLENGEIVGATKSYLESLNLDKYPHRISFPTVFDGQMSPEEFLTDENILSICHTNPHFQSLSSEDQALLRARIQAHYQQLPFVAATFTLNELGGTPSFIIFDEHYTILESYFGHIDPVELETKLTSGI